MKAVILLPTYNERENIVPLLSALQKITATIKGYEFAFLVVDDNSPDGTQEAVGEYQKTHKNVFLISGEKEGLGHALLRGMAYAVDTLDAQYIGQIDADLSHDATKLPEFFAAITGGHDFVVGSRYIPGGAIPPNWGIHRKIFSVVGNAIVRFGLGFPRVHDWTGGFRVFHKRYYEELAPQMRRYGGYVFQIAFLHKAVLMGARVYEVPFHFTDRKYGRSKIAPLQYIKNVLLYVARARARQAVYGSFAKFAIVGTIGFIINTIVLEVLVNAGQHPAVGSALGAETAIISNFFFNNRWTFKGRQVHGFRLIPKFLQFNLTSVGAILIQAGTVAAGTFFYGVAVYRWFYILGVGIGLIWNYMMYSRVIWKK
jgi:dolichol-phosphate mannosyltransferase